ncbi:HNH endonuclease signature motif containing protein [uncultured Microbacterium sp.]|uniref:HNH endonuclease n=1 Tax=uncultured Microbacterium sp. TaxID=191216 RepID=UPI0026013625|nr:HNH endonuclease signature motif containing protein [uncultured Microbacterium sp.]
MSFSTPPPSPPDGSDLLAVVLGEVLDADAALAAAEARKTRALARAGRLTLDVMAGQRASSRAAEMALREVASEIAAAGCLSDRSVQAQIGRAMTLVDHFPATVDAWEAGALSRAHVQAIMDAGTPVPVDKRAEFDVLAVATAEGLSPGRLRARLATLAERLQPTTITERHQRGREQRCVRVVRGENGMSDLIATLPTVLAVGIYDRLTQQSRALIDARQEADAPQSAVGTRDETGAAFGLTPAGEDAAGAPSRSADTASASASASASTSASTSSSDEACAGNPIPSGGESGDVEPDTRSTDQVRADILADLLLTAAPDADPTRTDDGPGTLGAIRARVQVVVPALSVLDPARENLDPAELIGHGPIDIDTAQRLAEATRVPWDRVLTHPVTGAVLCTDTYQRTAAIDRYLRARDRHCRWPGCTAPAVRCEIDHNLDYALGGKTHVCNLCHFCQRHHTQKQFTRWQVRQLPGGVIEFTSPTGRVYTDHPLPYSPAVRFTTDEPPASTLPQGTQSAPF